MRLLTSESVTPGHPDKLCDQISDGILDAYLTLDPTARVAAEVLASAHGITIAGEVNSSATVDAEAVAREVIRGIGYTAENGLDPDEVPVYNHLTAQSSEIHAAVDGRTLGAGDQGMMFGYATDETRALMPLPLMAARALTDALIHARESGDLPWLRPDGKTQVTVEYRGGIPTSINAVVVSTQHSPDIDIEDVRHLLATHVVTPALDRLGFPITADTRLHLNPAGSWTLGGPAADSGLTGRKIIVDTYGGASRHGGGAFSGKDPSKVDRSGAYAARHAARAVVAEGWAHRAEVQLSYAIGEPEPVSISIETFGTSFTREDQIVPWLIEQFDFTPRGIIDRLGLEAPIYQQTACRGHFGHRYLPWEKP